MIIRYYGMDDKMGNTIDETKIVREVYDDYELNKLICGSNPGDTIIFTSIISLGAEPERACEVYSKLLNAGMQLVFLKHPHLNSALLTNSNDKYELMHDQITLAVQASTEHKRIHGEKVRKGLAAARAKGIPLGMTKGRKLTTAKSIRAKEIIRTDNRQFGGNLTNEETARKAGISIKTLYRYKREITEELKKEGNNQ